MIPVVDVFAGPGGLNEGFSAVRTPTGSPIFNVVASFEKDQLAVSTLQLRATVRLLEGGAEHPSYKALLAGRITHNQFLADPAAARANLQAKSHVKLIELGEPNRPTVREAIRKELRGRQDWVLIGGPPCQAYSLVGRARRSHDSSFADDEKHFLYREYLDIIDQHRPAVFVMENVKGLLSASHGGQGMFQRIIDDLGLDGAYEIRSLVSAKTDLEPGDFVIRAEDYGVPQRRHRVILVGIRSDVASRALEPLKGSARVTVRDAIGDLPSVTSELSKATHEVPSWAAAWTLGTRLGLRRRGELGRALDPVPREQSNGSRDALRAWYGSSGERISLHVPRRHMAGDLARYAYLATLAEWGWFPKVNEFPTPLLPKHSNLAKASTPFLDRFKVQTWDQPSSTVASHISKDGHYYIHPDVDQMRSLTVREAARLQTFPDDYFFCGPRTAQFHQVGNAVPPLLATQIAERVAELLGRV